MKLMISAGFGEPFSDEWAARIEKVATGVRQDVPHGADHLYVKKLAENVHSHGMDGIFIVGGWMYLKDDGRLGSDKALEPNPEHVRDQARQTVYEWQQLGASDERLCIEVGNELDLSYWKEHLPEFHRMTLMCHEAVRELSADVRIITGSTSNFNKRPWPWQSDRGYELLDEICSLDWPCDTLQGLHPYRTGHRQNEWPSFNSEKKSLAALREVLRGRKVAITEAGWHEGGEWSRDDIASFTRDEIRMWRDFGATVFVLYQVQDGLGNTSEDRFGVYSSNGDPKPVADAMTEWKEHLA